MNLQIRLQNGWKLSMETGADTHAAADLMRLLNDNDLSLEDAGYEAVVEAGFSSGQAKRLCGQLSPASWKQFLDRCRKLGIRLVALGEEAYPPILREVPDPPAMLYVLGQLPDFERSIAVVGTRKCSAYGKSVTEMLLGGTSYARPVIVSGLAYGIDAIAHQTALQCGLITVAVLANGLDHIYPASHRGLADSIVKNGCLISEFPPGVKPRPHLFPRRNRIVAGLSRLTLVIESALKGGSLITAGIAESYHREVCAVPGGIDQPQSAGCLDLLSRHQANMVRSADELATIAQWPDPQQVLQFEGTACSDSVYEVLHKLGPMTVDQLVNQLPISVQDLQTKLLHLQLNGLIINRTDQKFAVLNP